MHKLLEANCDRFDKLLSKSYVLKIHLQIFFAKQRVKVQKVHVEKKNPNYFNFLRVLAGERLTFQAMLKYTYMKGL